MGKVLVGDFRTGGPHVEVPYTSYLWTQRRNAPESITATFDLNDQDVRNLQLRNTATPGKSFLAVVEEIDGGEWFPGGGQLLKPSYDRDSGELTLTAPGIWAFLYGRSVLPPAALTIPVTEFLIPDPADSTKTIANPALGTAMSGWSRGTIGKKILEQMMAWPDGDVPIVLPDDVAGTDTETFEGLVFKSVGSALSDFTNREGGPDIEFQMRYRPDRLGVEWVYRAGTEEQPELRSSTIHRWDLRVEQSSARNLKVSYDGEGMGSLSWATGGREADTAMVARQFDRYLLDAGFPLMEIIDTSHTDVSEWLTLEQYASANLARGRGATEVWSFQVKKDEKPYLGQYGLGDLCQLIIANDPYIPDSPPEGYVREIASLSGDDGDWVTIGTTEVTV